MTEIEKVSKNEVWLDWAVNSKTKESNLEEQSTY